MSNPLLARCGRCGGVMSKEREGDGKPGICFMCSCGFNKPGRTPGARFEYTMSRGKDGKEHPVPGTCRVVIERAL